MKKRKVLNSVWLLAMFLGLILFLPWKAFSQVTLTVGDGAGDPGSSENEVVISLDNPVDEVSGLQFDICDVDDYLTITGVETTSRTEEFYCDCNELENGCARILALSMSAELIDKGSGPVFIVKYEVREDAPFAEARDLNLENVTVSDETSDLEVTEVPGHFCLTSCKVNIDPEEATANPGDTIQFSATNTGDCLEEPVYTWEVESEIGSEIDASGLYTAGENDTGLSVTDKVTVTDNANAVSATAVITVKTLEECRVDIDPSSKILTSGESIQFRASNTGDCSEEPSYAWEVETEIGSTISADGFYTAGNNTGTDIVTVYDLANLVSSYAEITVTATIQTQGVIYKVRPEWILGSEWDCSFHYISIFGRNTSFSRTSRLSFNPGDDIWYLGNISVKKNRIIALIILNQNPQIGCVDVTVTTGIGEDVDVYRVTGEDMLRIR